MKLTDSGESRIRGSLYVNVAGRGCEGLRKVGGRDRSVTDSGWEERVT